MRRLAIAALPALLMLGACGGNDDRDTPGTLSPSQDAELNDAAAALDARVVINDADDDDAVAVPQDADATASGPEE